MTGFNKNMAPVSHCYPLCYPRALFCTHVAEEKCPTARSYSPPGCRDQGLVQVNTQGGARRGSSSRQTLGFKKACFSLLRDWKIGFYVGLSQRTMRPWGAGQPSRTASSKHSTWPTPGCKITGNCRMNSQAVWELATVLKHKTDALEVVSREETQHHCSDLQSWNQQGHSLTQLEIGKCHSWQQKRLPQACEPPRWLEKTQTYSRTGWVAQWWRTQRQRWTLRAFLASLIVDQLCSATSTPSGVENFRVAG